MEQKRSVFYHSTIWQQDGILFTKLKKDLIIDLKIAKEIVLDRKEVFGRIDMPFFIDLNDEPLYVDPQARRYFASPDAWNFVTAGALLTSNKVLEFMGTAWLILDKPVVPVRIFSDKRLALEWLELYKPIIRV